jgi:hypothetical protein
MGGRNHPCHRHISGSLQINGGGLAPAVGSKIRQDLSILVKIAHPGTLQDSGMHEGVSPAAIRRDDAIALVLVEEFSVPMVIWASFCPANNGHAPAVGHPGFG